ncbi:MAG: hypothetical protein ACETV1_02830 [Candidatus Bathyarchaeia archaeon]
MRKVTRSEDMSQMDKTCHSDKIAHFMTLEKKAETETDRSIHQSFTKKVN